MGTTVFTILQDIYIHNFIFTLSSYLQYYLQVDIDSSLKINTTSHLTIVINNILYILLYKKATKNTINELLTILDISKHVTNPIRNNRNYERIKKKPFNIGRSEKIICALRILFLQLNMVINIK